MGSTLKHEHLPLPINSARHWKNRTYTKPGSKFVRSSAIPLSAKDVRHISPVFMGLRRIRAISDLFLAGNTHTSVVLRAVGVQDGRPYDKNYVYPNRFTLVRCRLYVMSPRRVPSAVGHRDLTSVGPPLLPSASTESLSELDASTCKRACRWLAVGICSLPRLFSGAASRSA